jgi:hypothetical protein
MAGVLQQKTNLIREDPSPIRRVINIDYWATEQVTILTSILHTRHQLYHWISFRQMSPNMYVMTPILCTFVRGSSKHIFARDTLCVVALNVSNLVQFT